MDILDATHVNNCWFGGSAVSDLRGTISTANNVFDSPDPEFDDAYRPRSAKYTEAGVGYRPVGSAAAPAP